MPTSSERGIVEFFEDFVGLDVVADRSEYAVDTDPAVQVVAGSGGEDGVVRITCDAGQSNVGGIMFGQLQWSVYDNWLEFTARVKISALGTASERVFVGLTDAQADTLSEMPFTGATTVLTATGDPDDAIGFFWEGDMTGNYWQPGSVDSDTAIIGSATYAMDAVQRTKAAITAATWHELKFRVDSGATYAEFYVDGEQVYVFDGGSTTCISDVPLIPEMVATEGTGAMNVDLDYVLVRKGRTD